MSMASLERAILAEARVVTGRPKLRKKDIWEWTTGPALTPAEGEKAFYLPDLQINTLVAD